MEGKWKVQGARCKAQGYLECGMWKGECRRCCCWNGRRARADTSGAQLLTTQYLIAIIVFVASPPHLLCGHTAIEMHKLA